MLCLGPPRIQNRWRGLCALLCLALVPGCDGKQRADELDEVVEVPERYAAPEAPDQTEPREQAWCSSFQSEQLGPLHARALRGNLDLRSAWARLRQAEAAAQIRRASLFPSVDADAEVSERKQQVVLPGGQIGGGGGQPPGGPGGSGGSGGGGEAQQFNFNVRQYRTSVGASYELDIWGRLAKQRQAARLDAEATRADAEGLAITVLAQVTERWFDVVYRREQVELLEAQIEDSEEYLRLLQVRFGQGLSGALDLEQQRQQLETLRGQEATAEAALGARRAELAALLGQAPAQLERREEGQLPPTPPIPKAGVPAELLEQRPDVRSAYLRLKAADARTASAARDRLPRVRLSLSLFYQAQTLTNLLDELLWSVGGAISQPLFQGGRLNAQLRQSEALSEQRLYDYAAALLSGIRDVERALFQIEGQRRFTDSLRAQLSSAEESLGLALGRYQAGDTSYLRVLTALQAVNSTQQNLLQARRQELSTRVQLCRALGGDWTRDLERLPDPHQGDDEDDETDDREAIRDSDEGS